MPVRKSADGLLIIGHGTRDKQGVEGFLEVVRQTAELLPNHDVQPAFLELASPSIAEGFRHLVSKGARQIRAMPFLLFAAGHVRHDIPQALAAVQREHHGVRVEQVGHLGCRPEILELSARRYHEATAGWPRAAREETFLVLVGRGSRDRRATAEMHKFAELRRQRIPIRAMSVCFLAMERPDLQEALAGAAQSGAKRVVVQPHLLFSGYLVDRLRREVDGARRRWPHIDWDIVKPLGPDRLLAEAGVAALGERNEPENLCGLAAVGEGESRGGNPGGRQTGLVPGWISG